MLLTHISNDNSRKTSQFNYNQAEKRLAIDNFNGLGLSYTFDELGRRTQVIVQDNAITYTTNYSYDRLGRLDQLFDGNGNLIVDYDYHLISGQLSKGNQRKRYLH